MPSAFFNCSFSAINCCVMSIFATAFWIARTPSGLIPASGAIAAGELVTTAASGAVATHDTPSAANDVQVIGVALSAAASSLVKVLLFR